LPASALAFYRSRVDNQARRWLDEGKAARDPQRLRRLVDEMFCSRFTEQALDLLGDLAFERGDFDEADHWWRLLAPPASERDSPGQADELLFPDSHMDPARIRAKQMLTILFRGRPEAARAELQAFRQIDAAASGDLAGRSGNYADIVAGLIETEGLLLPALRRGIRFLAPLGCVSLRSRARMAPPGRSPCSPLFPNARWRRGANTPCKMHRHSPGIR
jgi:hypothetical protein